MNYQELKTKHAKILSEFPMFFAFSNAQLEEGIKKTQTSAEFLCRVPGGGFIRKADKDAFKAMLSGFDTDRKDCFADDAHLTEALRYELGNHEYGYTGNATDALNTLEMSLDNERDARIFAAARKQYVEENED